MGQPLLNELDDDDANGLPWGWTFVEGNDEHGEYYWNEVTGESSEQRPETMDHGSFAEMPGMADATGMGRGLGSFAGSSRDGSHKGSYANLAPIGEIGENGGEEEEEEEDETPMRLNVSFKKRK